MSVYEAASSGDRRGALEALRDHLAAQVDEATDRRMVHCAPLAKQLADVLRELDEMPLPKGSSVDEFSARVAARRAAAARTDSTTG